MYARLTLTFALVALVGVFSYADTPAVGKAAPAIDLEATSIKTVLPKKKDAKKLTLKDLEGKTVVLFFYPKAMTGG